MAAQIPSRTTRLPTIRQWRACAQTSCERCAPATTAHGFAHPALAAIASEIFNKHMPTPNQLFVRREDVTIGPNDLLNMNVPGKITEEGIRKNLNIGLGYTGGMDPWRGMCSHQLSNVPSSPFSVSPFLRSAISHLLTIEQGGCRNGGGIALAALAVGSATASPRPRASCVDKQATRLSYSRSRPTSWHPKRPRATNSRSRPSISSS